MILHAVSCVHANPACPHPDIVRTPIDFVRTTGLSAFLWSGRRDSRTLCRLFRLHSPLLFSWSICSAFAAVHSVHANPACPHPDIVRTPIDFVRTTGLSAFLWSGRRDSDPRLSPWQGDTLPLSHSRERDIIYQTIRKKARIFHLFMHFLAQTAICFTYCADMI